MLEGVRRRTAAQPVATATSISVSPTTASGHTRMGDLMEYPPTYCRGRLFVDLERGRTVAVDAATGKVIWSRAAPGPTASSPAIAGQNVVVSSHGGTVTALRQSDGELVWQLRTNVPVESSPVAVGGTVYVGASDGRLFALAAATGRTRWIYDFRGRISSSPSVVGGLVCITTYTGAVGCLHRDGRQPRLDPLLQARRLPLRELLLEPVERRAAHLRRGPHGQARRARGAER